MAFIRATPTTALSTVRQLGSDLSRWIKDAGALPPLQALGDSLERLQAYCGESVIDVDVLLDHPDALSAAGSITPAIATFLAPGIDPADLIAALHSHHALESAAAAATQRPLRLHLAPAGQPPAFRAGVPRAPVLVFVSTALEPAEASSRAAVDAADGRPLAILVAPEGSSLLTSVARRIRGTAWACDTLADDRLSASTLVDRLHAPPVAGALDLMRADAAARALESLAVAFGLALEQEVRGIKAKRALAQQRVAKLPARGQGTTPGEVVGEIRSVLQRQFADFSRGVDDRFESAFAPPLGREWQAIDADLAGIADLERERRAKTTGLRVPASVEEAWHDALVERVAAHCQGDLVAMRDLFRVVGAEVERLLAAAGGPPALPQFQFVPEERLRRLLQGQLQLQRHYQGEVPRTGFFEYVMIARRYQMILFMFFSAFGLSFLRSYREFMIPAAVLLLSFGGLNVFNSVKKERVESTARELEKAREALRAEGRRMLLDVHRGWTSLVGQHLNDQLATVVGHIETATRDFHARHADESAQDRQRLQRQLQGFETLERKLAGAGKGRDSVATAVAQLRGELRQLAGAALRIPAAQSS